MATKKNGGMFYERRGDYAIFDAMAGPQARAKQATSGIAAFSACRRICCSSGGLVAMRKYCEFEPILFPHSRNMIP